MKIRNLVLTVVTVAAFAPLLANASPEKASVKACATAFASSIAAPGAASPGYKLAYRSDVGSPLTEYVREYEFTLEAHDKAGVAIARARCSTDSNGVVTAISAIPLKSKFGTVASAF